MDPSRRHVLQLLASAGIAAGARETLEAQAPAPAPLRGEDLRAALALRGETLADDRLEIVRRAVQQAQAELAPIRALDLDDEVGLAVRFSPSRHGD